MEAIADKPFKPAFVVKQPEVSHLVHELRQLMQLTPICSRARSSLRNHQSGEQPDAASPLALKQIYAILDCLTQSSKFLRDGSVVLLSKSFGENL